MDDAVVIGAAVVGAIILLLVGLLLRRRSGDADASRRAHEAARARDPPVDIGDTVEFGVVEFTDHHSGERVAVGKVEGFVIFTESVPDGIAEGDAIRATVLSFNPGHTSADARYEGRG